MMKFKIATLILIGYFISAMNNVNAMYVELGANIIPIGWQDSDYDNYSADKSNFPVSLSLSAGQNLINGDDGSLSLEGGWISASDITYTSKWNQVTLSQYALYSGFKGNVNVSESLSLYFMLGAARYVQQFSCLSRNTECSGYASVDYVPAYKIGFENKVSAQVSWGIQYFLIGDLFNDYKMNGFGNLGVTLKYSF
jgi:hypothetical protein